MINPPGPRFLKTAAKVQAAAGAALGHDTRRDQGTALDAVRAAYGQAQGDYPGQASVNWLTSLRPADLDKLPAGARNWLVNMVKATASDPMSALMPMPAGGMVKGIRAANAARPAKLRAAGQELAKFHELKVADMVSNLKKMYPDRGTLVPERGTQYPAVWDAAQRATRNASNRVIETGAPAFFSRTGLRQLPVPGKP